MELTAKTLADLISALRSHQCTPLEKRRAPRVGLRVKVEIWHESHGQLSVWVRDVSAGGANLAAPVEMNVGDSLSLLLAATPATQVEPGSDKICCTVKHCRKVASGVWSVGVKFETAPAK